MLKLGDRVFWRSHADASRVAIGTIEIVNPGAPAAMYGIVTNMDKRFNCSAASVQPADKPFAKCLVIDRSSQYFKLAQDISVTVMEERMDVLDRCDLVMFTGGEDVSPVYYGEEPHDRSFVNPARDAKEARVWHEAKKRGIPCVGICRGAQFLNVMNGGRMVQHVTNHTSDHDMHVYDGRTIRVSSTHHQMMDPADHGQILAWAEGLSEKYEGLTDHQPCLLNNDTIQEPEVVWYEKSRDMCIQYHPEYLAVDSEGRLYFHELMEII